MKGFAGSSTHLPLVTCPRCKHAGMADTYCPVCGQRDSWGCGHTGSQRRDARRHNDTKAHRSGACWHYDHAGCDPADCRFAGNVKPDGTRLHPTGYAPMLSHAAKRTRHERMV